MGRARAVSRLGENADAEPRTASDAIAAMDQRTWQALTTGHLELPRRRIHAGLWFRLLRALLDEFEHTAFGVRNLRGVSPPSLGRLRASRCVLGKVCGDRMKPESGSTVADAGGGGNGNQRLR